MSRPTTPLISRWFIASLLALAVTATVQAHRDDYLDETIVYLTLEQAEVEMEYWFDYGRNGDTSGDFTRHHAALEWGITDHWMIDGRATIQQAGVVDSDFGGGRVETRCRFDEEGARIVDIALSTELNWKRDEDGKMIPGLEPRLILSKDVKEKLNFTINLSDEIPLKTESPAFLAAMGIRYNWTELLRLGSEWHQEVTNGGGSIIPQLWLAFRSGLTVKIGYSTGYGQNKDDFSRLAMEYEF